MNENFDKTIAWEPHLTRPFTLFGSSFWCSWYDSDIVREFIGAHISKGLFIETEKNVSSFHLDTAERVAWLSGSRTLGEGTNGKLGVVVERGETANEEVLRVLGNTSAPVSLEDALRFMNDFTLYATVLPTAIYAYTAEKTGLEALAERLRALRKVSLYPELHTTYLMPKVYERLRETGIKEQVEAVAELVTLAELTTGKVAALPERLLFHEAGKRFIYQTVNRVETIHWSDKTLHIVEELDLHGVPASGTEFKGQVGYKGIVRGTARVVHGFDPSVGVFNEGDILVSINADPALMPLIVKSAALVTDEGGIGCHASILSREMKKPCVVGTKVATKVLKSGDTIEVDADAGVIRLLKQAAGR